MLDWRGNFTTFADNSRHGSDWAAKIYTDARAHKKRHPHAVRILARTSLRVIWACWRDGTCYNPVTHRTNSKAIDKRSRRRLWRHRG